MIVGARRRRAEVGMRVKLAVVLYPVVDSAADRELWAYTIMDAHQTPIARAARWRDDRIGREFDVMNSELALLLDVKLARDGSRLVRVDERWDVAVRSLSDGARDELPFRVS